MRLNRTLTATAAALIAATCLTAVAAPAHAAGTGGNDPGSSAVKVSRVVTTKLAAAIEHDAADAGYPTTEDGSAYAEQAVTSLTDKKMDTLYWANGDQSEFCVAAGPANSRATTIWMYGSDLGKPFKTNARSILRGDVDGVCGDALRAGARKTAAVATARQFATVAEAHAAQKGAYPSKGKLLRWAGNSGAGYQLAQYRVVRATKSTPSSFQLCVTHKSGAWASWDSANGGIVAAGEAGKTCSFPTA